MKTQQMLEDALRHHHAGRLAQAESLYLQALSREPDHAPALHWLAMLEMSTGRTDSALRHIERSGELRPDDAEIQQALGIVRATAGRFDDALAAFAAAIRLQPSALAYRNLATAWMRKGDAREAVRAASKAVELDPGDAEAHVNLGEALQMARQFSAAVDAYSKAISLRPDHARAHDNLGNTLEELAEFQRAIFAHLQAISIQPSAEFWTNLGNAYRKSGARDKAISAYQSALQLKPDMPAALNNLGVCFSDLERWDDAIRLFRQAIQLRPDYAEAFFNLGNTFSALSQFPQAIEQYLNVLRISPDFSAASAFLASAYTAIGEMEKSLAASRRALQLEPANAVFHSSNLYLLHFVPGVDARTIFEEHRRWDQLHARPLASEIRRHENDSSPDRRLRIGYVSPDFRDHSVAFFFENLLAHRNRADFEVFCYSNVAKPDHVTERIRRAADHWVEILPLSDAKAAERIRADGIDLLVDLAGHTSGQRLLLFARKPAPIQLTYLGYPDTTGLGTIDYRITDAVLDPPSKTEELYTERLIRLPRTFASYRPPADIPAVGPLPALSNGYVTFACFSILAKVQPKLLETWAALLTQVADSRLLVVAAGLGDASIVDRLMRPFAAVGISPARVRFLTRQPPDQYLALHQQADILLDTFPVNGHTITCHALWMGLPAVTLAGDTCCQRLGASVLQNLNLADLIADSPEQYVRIATQLSRDLPALANLRASLRRRMAESPLLDGAQIARDVESEYRRIRRNGCAQAAT